MGELTDAELLEQWRGGDRAAAEALMRRHYASVLRYFELNASWAADDLAQRTFVACVERADRVREVSAFRAYLMGIARRQLAMHQRELSKLAPLDGFEEEPQNTTKLSTIVARSHEQLLVLRALTSLPRRPQLLLVLHYWDAVRTPELATHFAVPASTIRSRLARARDLLRRRMDTMARGPRLPVDDHSLQAMFAALTISDPVEQDKPRRP